MNRILPVLTLASLMLVGCCTKIETADSQRIEGKEWGSDFRWCGIFSGYGATGPERYDALYTPVTDSEFAKLLCEDVELEDYASCVNRAMTVYRESGDRELPIGHSTAGPLVMKLDGEIYQGNYTSTPFAMKIHVSSGRDSCRGSYDAFAGSTEAILRVRCDDGRRGDANLVLSRHGRDGIGAVSMDDGTKGKILFGHTAIDLARTALDY